MTARHLIAYLIIAIGVVALIALPLWRRRIKRRQSRYERIDLGADKL